MTVENEILAPLPCLASTADDPASLAWRQLFITSVKLHRRIEQMLAPTGLAASQFEALARIGGMPGLIQQDLAAALILTKGNIGALVDRLEGLGLLRRSADQTDRRVNRLYLTTKGQELVEGLIKTKTEMVADVMGSLSEPQMRQLRALLQLIEPG